MKRILLVLSLLTFISAQACSQWYVNRYNVPEIGLLNEQQLNESLSRTKTALYSSLAVTGSGGLVILMQTVAPYEETEESTFIQTLMGENLVNDLYIGFGVAMVAAGLVATVSYLARLGTIKSNLAENFSQSGSFYLSPSLLIEESSHSVCPGVSIAIRF